MVKQLFDHNTFYDIFNDLIAKLCLVFWELANFMIYCLCSLLIVSIKNNQIVISLCFEMINNTNASTLNTFQLLIEQFKKDNIAPVFC